MEERRPVATTASLLDPFRAQLAESEASDRSFGIVAGFGFVGIGCIPLLRHGALRPLAIVPGVALLLLAVFAPSALRKPKRAWLFLGFVLGRVVNPVVLALLFYLVFTPTGLLMRLIGNDPLLLRSGAPVPSYWRPRSEPASEMEAQF